MHPKLSCKLIHLRTSGVVLERLTSFKQPCFKQPSYAYMSLYTYEYGEGKLVPPIEYYSQVALDGI